MSAEERRPNWMEVAAELLTGPRGVVKAIHVWWPLTLCLTVSRPADDAVAALAVFGAAACWGQAAILANDLADRRDDAQAGKRRWICGLPPWSARGVVAGIALTGWALAGAAGGGVRTQAAYAAALALALAYSVRPVRLKPRGLWGLAAYAGSACLADAVLPWTRVGGPAALLAVTGSAVFLDKWVNLHFHQVIDRRADQAAGTRTFAVAVGHERARRTLALAACLASAAMAVGVAYSALSAGRWGGWVAVGAAVVVAGMAVHVRRARRTSEPTALVVELPWHYLGLTTGLFRAVPGMLLVRLALADADYVWPLSLFGVLLLIEARQLISYRYR